MHKNVRFIFLCLFVLSALTNTVHADRVYSVGVVPQFDSRRITEIWQPILDAVSQSSGVQLKLTTSTDIPEFEQQFNTGDYDFAYMNPYHAIVANEKQGYTPILRDTGRSLFGIIVVKKDSPIQSVSELDGKTVAFPSPNALGAALLPRAEFDRTFNIKVNELYVKSHSSVYLNVLLGKAAAGGGVKKTLSLEPDEIRNQLRVLYETAKVPPHPLTVHPRVDTSIQEKVSAAFLELGNTEEGQKLLNNIPMKKIGKATIKDYDSLKSMGLDKYYMTK